MISGLGMGWSNCRHDFDSPFVLHGKKVPIEEAAKSGAVRAYKIVVEQPAAGGTAERGRS